MRHVRKSNASVRDRRFRGRELYANKLRPTLCGAEPTERDHSRQQGENLLRSSALRPDWLDDMCPHCLEILRTPT